MRGSVKPDRAHRTKGERVVPTRGDLLNGQAALEEMLVFTLEIAQFDLFRRQHGIDETLVFCFRSSGS